MRGRVCKGQAPSTKHITFKLTSKECIEWSSLWLFRRFCKDRLWMRHPIQIEVNIAHRCAHLEKSRATCYRSSGYGRAMISVRFEVWPEVFDRFVCLGMQSTCSHSFCDMRWYITVGDELDLAKSPLVGFSTPRHTVQCTDTSHHPTHPLATATV